MSLVSSNVDVNLNLDVKVTGLRLTRASARNIKASILFLSVQPLEYGNALSSSRVCAISLENYPNDDNFITKRKVYLN